MKLTSSKWKKFFFQFSKKKIQKSHKLSFNFPFPTTQKNGIIKIKKKTFFFIFSAFFHYIIDVFTWSATWKLINICVNIIFYYHLYLIKSLKWLMKPTKWRENQKKISFSFIMSLKWWRTKGNVVIESSCCSLYQYPPSVIVASEHDKMCKQNHQNVLKCVI